jgi:ABC-2 type transport system permease protein
MSPIKMWHCYYGITREQMVRIFRIWGQTFIPSLVNTALYFIIFGQVLGSRVGQMGGVSYMMYIAPGLILMSVITNAYINTSGTLYSNRWVHSVDELIASPTPDVLFLMGYVSAGMLRAMIIAVLMTIVAFCFVGVHAFHLGAAFLAALLCALFFALAGFINGMLARSYDDTSMVPTFILAPLSYLGGVFYNIDRLPHAWYIVSLCNPIHYLIEMFRYALIGVATPSYHLWNSVLVLVGMNVLLFVTCLWMMRRGVGMKS